MKLRCEDFVRITILSLFFFTTSALAADVDRGMKEIVKAFYTAYVTVRPSGVPSEKEQLTLKPYLSASLRKLLKEAAAAERRYRRTTKGEVPPLIEGDLFTSLFEGASAFTVLSCDSRTASCPVAFSYRDPESKVSTTWQDKVYLVKDSSGWLVDDIEFQGNWQFMHKGRLKELLKQVIEEGS